MTDRCSGGMRKGFHYKLLAPYRITKDRGLNLMNDLDYPVVSEDDFGDIRKGVYSDPGSLASLSLEEVRMSEDTTINGVPLMVLPDGQVSSV